MRTHISSAKSLKAVSPCCSSDYWNSTLLCFRGEEEDTTGWYLSLLEVIVSLSSSSFKYKSSYILLPTWSSWTLRWLNPHSFCLHIEAPGCHMTWSDTNRNWRRPRRHRCCRVAMAPTVRSRHWWFGFAAGKDTSFSHQDREIRSANIHYPTLRV